MGILGCFWGKKSGITVVEKDWVRGKEGGVVIFTTFYHERLAITIFRVYNYSIHHI
ncbi:hypothetical protein FWH09_01290 [Candidatus Saccharibacteria bacterium]|nr:hypothetical protein [Candidatus Saccharibacteria bacterium]